MARFKIIFGGFAYVDADDEEEAREKFDDEDYAFCEYGIETVEEVDDFVVEW